MAATAFLKKAPLCTTASLRHPFSFAAKISAILPTILELLGQKNPFAVQGQSFVSSLLKSEEPQRESALITYDAHDRGIIAKTLRTARYKLTIFMGESYGELFDLEKDPSETHNLWSDLAHGAEKNRLIFQLTQRMLETFDPRPTAQPNGKNKPIKGGNYGFYSYHIYAIHCPRRIYFLENHQRKRSGYEKRVFFSRKFSQCCCHCRFSKGKRIGYRPEEITKFPQQDRVEGKTKESCPICPAAGTIKAYC